MSVRGKGGEGIPEDECDPRTASAEAYSAFARRLCARDARCAGTRPASVDELWDAVRTMAVHDRRQRLQGLLSPPSSCPSPTAAPCLTVWCCC